MAAASGLLPGGETGELHPGRGGHLPDPVGFRALTKLAAAFPDNFMVSCVGTKVLVVGG